MVPIVLLALLPLAVAAGSVATAVAPVAEGGQADRSDAEFLQPVLADAEAEVAAALAALQRPLPEADRSLARDMLALGGAMAAGARTLVRERGLPPVDAEDSPDPGFGSASYLDGRIAALERLAGRCHAVHAASADPDVLAFAARHLPDLLRRLEVAQRRLAAAASRP